MKQLTFFIISAFVLFSCSGEKSDVQTDDSTEIDSNYCECEELTLDKPYNHFYRFERTEPFTGKCESFYPDGTVKVEKHFEKGKVHGPLITYHDNGQVHEEQEFKMNVQVGEYIIYTKSGKVRFHALYKNGQQTKLIESNPQFELDD